MIYQYWLANVKGIGAKRAESLIRYFGSPEKIYKAGEKELAQSKILRAAEQAGLIESRKNWHLEEEFRKLEDKKIGIVTTAMTEYPSQLKNLEGAPFCIYYKGRFPKEEEYRMGMVGARMCTPYGKTMARELAELLASNGISIVSGMASGIDRFSHEGAIRGKGVTYAVLGCGADICYPEENYRLYGEIAENGGILSEYPPGTRPRPQFFPARNRMISGLSEGVIVIEAREKSGSLITADFALEQGRDVYVVPGRCTDPLSKGCNELIRQGAGIICSGQSLMEDLQIINRNSQNFQIENKISLEKEETLVYSCLGLAPKPVNELLTECGLDLIEIINILSSLEEKGLAAEYYKNNYVRTN